MADLKTLRDALRKLPATGEVGFEGLISAALSAVSSIPFRLAGSGSQFGVDASPTYQRDAVCFECKRYDGQVPRSQVLSKITEIAIDKRDVDLWVLAVTSELRSQLSDSVRLAGEAYGIATLTLDYSERHMSPLAALLSMAETDVAEFLRAHLGDVDMANEACVALGHIKNYNEFRDHAFRIERMLRDSMIGAGVALQANTDWLSKLFSSKDQARAQLGQPLTPADHSKGVPLIRHDLIARIEPFLTGRPDETILALLGDEGNGKSWVLGQSWIDLDYKPLTLFLSAEEFREEDAVTNLEEVFIERLARQTDAIFSESLLKRWQRKFERWRELGPPQSPRLVVCIDGLNQRPKVDWGRILDAIRFWLVKIGGRLAVTSRTAYFTNEVERRLFSNVDRVTVGEWSRAERDEILADFGIDGNLLLVQVGEPLRNPRLLATALSLVRGDVIKSLDELNVSRLLFEYLLEGEREGTLEISAIHFARTLQDHGVEIIQRTTDKDWEDLRIFDSGSLEAVSEGRFFQPLVEDPTLCSLSEDGLTLALGLAIIHSLNRANRNGLDLVATLHNTIEPVSALDKTADVLLAAATVACLDMKCPSEVAGAIITAFTEVQNPNEDWFESFAALASQRPEPFLRAAHDICLGSEHKPNFDWVETALHRAKLEHDVWSEISLAIAGWLDYYSLSPERKSIYNPDRDPSEKVKAERRKNTEAIDSNLAALTEVESRFLAEMERRDEGDLGALAKFAFSLMAGMPLASLSRHIVRWEFFEALNQGLRSPHDELQHLIRLNRVDWSETDAALKERLEIFEGKNISTTGKWCLYRCLRCLDMPEDARKADVLFRELRPNPLPQGWRRVEQICPSDPCDPDSAVPEDLTSTVEEFDSTDVSQLRTGMGQTSQDLFFKLATPAMARFEPVVAVGKYQELIADITERVGFSLRQGLFALEKHNALVSQTYAARLVNEIDRAPEDSSLEERDEWIIGQYRLLTAFPLLSATEQVDVLTSRLPEEDLLLQLLDVSKPLAGRDWERRLLEAWKDGDELKQFRLLALGRIHLRMISDDGRECVSSLIRSESERVRHQALGIVAALRDPQLCEVVVESGWDANVLEATDGYEAWYGSLVILESARLGFISSTVALDRVAPQLYGNAATHLDDAAQFEVARRVDASIVRVINLDIPGPVPAIELQVLPRERPAPSLYDISEREVGGAPGPLEAFERLAESPVEIQARQDRLGETFEVFRQQLTQAKARIVLEHIGFAAFDKIVAANRDLAGRWCEMILGLPPPKRRMIQNFGYVLGRSISFWSPEEACELFKTLSGGDTVLRVTFGRARTGLEAKAIWSSCEHDLIEGIRFERLDFAESDQAIADEVIAALQAGKQSQLEEYVRDRLIAGEPEPMARAIMVAGFSTNSEFFQEVIDRYSDAPGLLGKVSAVARYAYERNIWAEHWFGKMLQATTPDNFWRASVLFLKIVDDRFDVWCPENTEGGTPFGLFWPGVASGLSQRFKKQKNTRNKKLFGEKAPPPIFLRAGLKK